MRQPHILFYTKRNIKAMRPSLEKGERCGKMGVRAEENI